MRFDIMTLFPQMVENILGESIIGRAQTAGILEVHAHNIRDYTKDIHRKVDDTPYGGGMGMLMSCQPVFDCYDAVKAQAPDLKTRTVYMSPQGKPFCQEEAKRLAGYGRLILVCGHYEGIDERFIEECVDEEISLGDFVLTGGEIPAMAVCDAVCRLIPGVLASEESYTGESHWDGLLEYPHYSRPEEWHGMKVPEILRSGNHAKIAEWRHEQALIRTLNKRPDMLETAKLTIKDRKFIDELKKQK